MRPSPITPWCWEMGHLGEKMPLKLPKAHSIQL